MLIDEWNQYINLYPGYVQYFEFNDVILDINGCALAVLTLMIFGVEGTKILSPLWKRSEFIGLSLFIIVVAVALFTCAVTLYEAGKCSNTWLVLNILHEPPTFWRKFPGRDAVYHIIQPMEAIMDIVLLSLLYFGMDSFRKTEA
jgi:hypothetical protein